MILMAHILAIKPDPIISLHRFQQIRGLEDTSLRFVPIGVRADMRENPRIKRSYSMIQNEVNVNGVTNHYGTGAKMGYTGVISGGRRVMTGICSRSIVKINQIKRPADKVLLVEKFRDNLAGSDS